MKQAYIFDMDGTLFQTDRILGHALEDVFAFLREQGRWTTETPLAEYRAIMGVPLPESGGRCRHIQRRTGRKLIESFKTH